jgi:DnaJ-class molecular chaperone
LSQTATDHYATLGLNRRCSPEQIRTAYRLLAKRHHPDLNLGSPDATTRAQQLNAAHEILSDPARRRAYDRELDSSKTERPRVGKIECNIKQDVYLRIEDFLRGTTLGVRVNDPANPTSAEIYQITIPPETAPGTRFRIPRTEPFEGGFVHVRVRARPGFRFKLRGSDLLSDLRISTQRAANGGRETIQGVTGTALSVPIPAGVRKGEIVRIAGKGLPKLRGGRGDLLIRIVYRPEVHITRKGR